MSYARNRFLGIGRKGFGSALSQMHKRAERKGGKRSQTRKRRLEKIARSLRGNALLGRHRPASKPRRGFKKTEARREWRNRDSEEDSWSGSESGERW